MIRIIYLDNASTTMVDPDVVDGMIPFLREFYGNPGSIHKMGRFASAAIEKSRERVANLISAEPNQIIFTSGGTESNNTVLSNIGSILARTHKGHVITTEIEHDSVLRPIKRECIKRGFDITFLHPNKYGSIEFSTVENNVREDTGFVSVMAVNNETGSENPIKEIGMLCAANGIYFHTDCVQAISTMRLNVKYINCDFMSISSHKIHGPKGVGALFVKDPSLIEPIILGGRDQEYGLRGGTENVAGIYGFGLACDILRNSIDVDSNSISILKQNFYARIKELLGNSVSINGQNITHPGKVLNLRIDGVHAETLVLLLGNNDVYVSAGSACRSKENVPSNTLLSMGLSAEEATQSVRFSFSKFNTEEEVVEAADKVAECVNLLRGYNG